MVFDNNNIGDLDMQALATLTNTALNAQKQPAAAHQMALGYITALFDRLSALYPISRAKWAKQPASLEAEKLEWAKALHDHAVSPQMIKRGLNTCKRAIERGDKWLPSAFEFCLYCCKTIAPEELGQPSLELAYLESARQHSNPYHRWSALSVMWAAKSISPYDWASWTDKTLRAAFNAAYQSNLDKLACGEQLPVAALPEIKKPSAPAPTGFFSELMAKLG